MTGTYYAVVDGDPLTSGRNSRVHAKGDSCLIKDETGQNRRMVFIGDSAYCERCDSVGVVVGGAGVSDMHRMIDMENAGRRQAVGGDWVICKCPERPRVLACYGRSWIIHDRGDITQQVTHASTAASTQSVTYDEQVRAVGKGASEGYPYFIETSDGRTEAGRLDSSAVLSRIHTDSADDYMVYWGDEALAHGEWK